MPISKLETFEIETHKWDAYCRQVKQFITLNKIANELQVAVLVTHVGVACYELMCDLCAPELPENKEFYVLVKIVQDHLEPQRTWQEMYAWKQWRNVEVFTIEGGEAVLWTDLVNGANLDFHLWPRAAAVAERLWSDMVINVSASGPVYLRLDSQRWRMLFRGINVQPVWPLWCSFNPDACLLKLAAHRK